MQLVLVTTLLVRPSDVADPRSPHSEQHLGYPSSRVDRAATCGARSGTPGLGRAMSDMLGFRGSRTRHVTRCVERIQSAYNLPSSGDKSQRSSKFHVVQRRTPRWPWPAPYNHEDVLRYRQRGTSRRRMHCKTIRMAQVLARKITPKLLMTRLDPARPGPVSLSSPTTSPAPRHRTTQTAEATGTTSGPR